MGAALSRIDESLRLITTPRWYLAGFGSGMAGWLWLQRGHFGLLLPLVVAAGTVVLLGLLEVRALSWRTRWLVLCLLVAMLAVGGMASAMVHRHAQGLTFEYDGFAQDEVAIDKLLHGQPIYGVSYAGTEVDGYGYLYNGVDLRHYVHWPLTILPGIPLKLATAALGLPFDYRMVTTLFLGAGIGAVMALPITYAQRFLVLIALFLNPMLMTFTLTGNDDICFVAMVLVTLLCLARGHPVLAALAAGAAAACKPFGALIVPVLFMVLWPSWRAAWPGSRRQLLLCCGAALAAPVLTLLPFVLWNPAAFWREMLFQSGGIADAYPISGFGVSALLVWLHVLQPHDVFSFILPEALAVAAVLGYGWRTVPRQPSMAWFLGLYVAAFLAFGLFLRAFNYNYVGALFAVAACVIPLQGSPLFGQAAAPASRLAA